MALLLREAVVIHVTPLTFDGLTVFHTGLESEAPVITESRCTKGSVRSLKHSKPIKVTFAIDDPGDYHRTLSDLKVIPPAQSLGGRLVGASVVKIASFIEVISSSAVVTDRLTLSDGTTCRVHSWGRC